MQYQTSMFRVSTKVRSRCILARPTTPIVCFNGKQRRLFLACSSSSHLGKGMRVYASKGMRESAKYAGEVNASTHAQHHMMMMMIMIMMMMMKSNGTSSIAS
jgi:hypothetical protein